MLPAELWTYLPPGLAGAAVFAVIGLRLLKQRDESRQSEWDRMRDLLDELRSQRDHLDGLVTSLTEDNSRLRTELARCREQHTEEDPR